MQPKVFQNPAGIYLFKVNNRNTRTRCEICSKLTYFTPCSSISIVSFEQVNAGWEPFIIEPACFTFVLQYCNTQQKVDILYIKIKCFYYIPKQ